MSDDSLGLEAGKRSKTLNTDARPRDSGGQLAGRGVKLVAQGSRESVIAFDANGDCVWINPAARRFLGLADGVPENGRLNLKPSSLASVNTEPAGPLSVGVALRPEILHGDSEVRFPANTGQNPRPESGARNGGVDISKQPGDETSKGSPTPVDTGQEILLNHNIETAKRMVRRVSHDFNNLVAVVKGYSEVLQGRPQLDDDSKQMVAMIARAASEIGELSDRMAGFADTPHFEECPSNLNLVIEQMLDSYGDLIPNNIEVEVEFGDPLPNVAGGEKRLRQACWNIWNNAIEAMPQGGRIICQSSTHWIRRQVQGQSDGIEPSRFVRLRVTDTGEGMDAEIRAAMFAPFFTTKSGKCRGNGATAVYETVRECGGFIEVCSKPGSGTCVDLYFSALEDTTLPAATQGRPTSP